MESPGRVEGGTDRSKPPIEGGEGEVDECEGAETVPAQEIDLNIKKKKKT